MGAPLAVGGSRLSWDELPAGVRAAVVAAAGAPVEAAISQPGGFSPGLASVLRLAGGGSVFVKAVNAARNPDSPGLHRREARVLAALPATVPAPRLRWSYDDGDWVVLMIEAVDGIPPAQPWRRPELTAFLELAATLAEQLTPAPLAAPAVQDYFHDDFTGWRRLVGEPAAAGSLDPWARRQLDRLAEVESGWPAAAAGGTLVHGDLRSDNVLLTARGPLVVDWPHACIGAGWLDLLIALPSIAMHGGGDPQRLWDGYPPARTADPDAVTAVLTAVAGYFVWQGRQPDPPGLPRVRAFQRAQGEASLAWLRRRLA
jgi:aminoglycoside phosphotransferase (APT) family kinase protein